jgi:hypothetical protein
MWKDLARGGKAHKEVLEDRSFVPWSYTEQDSVLEHCMRHGA